MCSLLAGSLNRPACAKHQHELGHGDDENGHVDDHEDHQDLAHQLIQPDPALAGEGHPRVDEVHVALAAHDDRLDLAPKRPVERDDGGLVGGQHAGLDAHEHGLGGDDEEEHAGDGDDEDDQGLPDGVAVVLGDLCGVADVPLVEAQGDGEGVGHEEEELGGGPVQGYGGPGGLEGLAEGREALVEAQLGGGGDDDVRPGGGELHGDEGDQEDADGARDEGDAVEDEAAGSHGDVQDEGAGHAAEVGGPPGCGAEEAVDLAEGGRDEGGL